MTQSYELKVPCVAMATSLYFLRRSICSHGCLSLGEGDQPLLPYNLAKLAEYRKLYLEEARKDEA